MPPPTSWKRQKVIEACQRIAEWIDDRIAEHQKDLLRYDPLVLNAQNHSVTGDLQYRIEVLRNNVEVVENIKQTALGSLDEFITLPQTEMSVISGGYEE